MTINTELKKIYEKHWDSLLSELYAFTTSDEYASPLLLKFKDDYFKADHKKIMFFGQETRGWQNKVNNQLKTIDEIMDGYDRYFIANNMRYEKAGKMNARSSFRSGVLNLKKGLNKRNIKVDLIWNNINKIGRDREKVGINATISEIEFNKFNVIQEEVKLLNPDFFVFFTGPDRDKEILKKFPNLLIEKHPKFTTKQIILFKNNEGVVVGLRTYHPNYLKGFYAMLDPHCLNIIANNISP